MKVIKFLKRPLFDFVQDFVFNPDRNQQPKISSCTQSGTVIEMFVSGDLGIETWPFQPMTVPLWVFKFSEEAYGKMEGDHWLPVSKNRG